MLDAAAARDLGLVTDVLGLDGFDALAERRLHENFRIPGVQETIQHYLAGLRTRRAG
ncbi:enoyl-CoA hydratase/isomerase [Bordetella pertussis]|nr:enoyl-CoA hydratase/isomerase [Bordetella pertussis]